MNKQVLITLAVIVGLLALWLLFVLAYPPEVVEEAAPVEVEDIVPTDMMEVEAPGEKAGSTANIEAVVQIVPKGLADITSN